MKADTAKRKAAEYLDVLCERIPGRRVGSPGNRMATNFVVEKFQGFGLEAIETKFECLDWIQQGATLRVSDKEYEVFPSPYTIGCTIEAPFVKVDTVEALEKSDCREKILLLSGEIALEQLMPKQFPFYNPEGHQQIYRLLEEKRPRAILTATSRNPELAGGMYPFPMIEDGDFDIPSVYLKDIEGKRLAEALGQVAALEIRAERIASSGHNVVAAYPGQGQGRIVICAHIDAKDDTPGALDNASGVAMMLILAELLEGYQGQYELEFVALNGEDHYSAQGQKEYIKVNRGRFGDILLAINTDVAGYIYGHSAFSLYGCSEAIERTVSACMQNYPSLQEGPAWYQSDHSIFIQQGCPAMAITSDQFMELSAQITHTSADIPRLVNLSNLTDIAYALRDLIVNLA